MRSNGFKLTQPRNDLHAGFLNITVDDLCSLIVDGTGASSILTEEDADFYYRRRSLLEMLPADADVAALSGSLGGDGGGRHLLAGGGGGGGSGDGSGATDPLYTLLSQNKSAATQVHILPRLKFYQCTGPFLSTSCPPGKVPLISYDALHQVNGGERLQVGLSKMVWGFGQVLPSPPSPLPLLSLPFHCVRLHFLLLSNCSYTSGCSISPYSTWPSR